MLRAKGVTREFEFRYFDQVRILDEFWRRTFVAFVAPLGEFFDDPTSAGTAILSRYLRSASGVLREIELEPEKFGRVLDYPRTNSRALALRIVTSPKGISLAKCARAFELARKANKELDALRASNPLAFDELQRERLRLKQGM